jgi:hypothetical protein
MVTVTDNTESRRDVSRAALHCVGVGAVFVSLLAAMATGVALADPAPPPGPDSSDVPLHDNSGDDPFADSGGDGPLQDNSGDDPLPSVDDPPDVPDEPDVVLPPEDGEDPPSSGGEGPPPSGGEDPPPEPAAPRVAAPRGDGEFSPVSPGHRKPRSKVSAQTTVIRRDSAATSSPPVVETAPPAQTAPIPDAEPLVVERPEPTKPQPEQRIEQAVTALVPRAAFAVKLSETTISPGSRVMATGLGCGPAAPVSLSVGKSPIGATLTDPQGTFEVALATGSLGVGRHYVSAECGETKNVALDVVLVSRVGTGAATTTLILLFMVSGVWYFGHRILSPTDPRSRDE